MSDQSKVPAGERFTMLEPRGPNTKLPGSETWPTVGLRIMERFTMLEPCAPLNPSPEELATRVVDGLFDVDPVTPSKPAPLPPVVLNLVAELSAAVAALDARGRAAALAYISTELPRRTAG